MDRTDGVHICPLRNSAKWGNHVSIYLTGCVRKSVVLIPMDKNATLRDIIADDLPEGRVWMFHFRNRSGRPYTEDDLRLLLSSVGEVLSPGDILTCRGGCTPGGLGGIKRLAAYGFEKSGEYCGGRLYWADSFMDMEKYSRWLGDPKHAADWRTLPGRENYGIDRVSPVVWELRRRP